MTHLGSTMNINLLAEFQIHGMSVQATIIDRDAYGCVMEGEGTCVQDAVVNALHDNRITFASERDERDACVAAMRSIRANLRLTADRRVEFLGFA